MTEPICEEWRTPLEPLAVWRKLLNQPGLIFFDSVRQDTPRGRWSFLACDPIETLVIQKPEQNGLARLAELVEKYESATVAGLPPFQGGVAGMIGYEFGQCLEPIRGAPRDAFQLPVLSVGIYDRVIAWDHHTDQAWFISHGFPAAGAQRTDRAKARIDELRRQLESPTAPMRTFAQDAIPASELEPCHAVPGRENLFSNLSAEQYIAMAARGVEYIHAGDVFQVNLSQRLIAPLTADPPTVYERLRSQNGAPFAGYYDLGEFQILSASPERFFSLNDGRVEARPIKGTRPRFEGAEADLYTAAELQQSEKDRAENVMIVDLLRNDLSRVCLPDSIHVSALCQWEQYQFVHHLVSVIEGRLAPDKRAIDLIGATFPGGSITGAPKIRAREIIAELEPSARGAYCGSLGYIGFDGSLDLSILIRTLVAGKGWLQMSVGGGVVAQSSPEAEYQESWHKANGLIQSALAKP